MPIGPRLAYELKWDGFRGLLFAGANPKIYSRAGRDLTPYFPELAAEARGLPQGCVIDGELVVWDGAAGRTSFTRLQKRLTAGRGLSQVVRAFPSQLACFDLLHDGTELMLNRPLAERRARLADVLGSSPWFSLCPQTGEPGEAEQWLTETAVAGVEGLVIKDLGGVYRPGRRDWRKLRRYDTTEAVIGGIVAGSNGPTSLLLGRYDAGGRLRYMGRTTPLSITQQRELAVLPQLGSLCNPERHPWPQPLPAAWTGIFNSPEPLRYVQLAPDLVAELQADSARERGRFRHLTRYVRIRAELLPMQLLRMAGDDWDQPLE